MLAHCSCLCPLQAGIRQAISNGLAMGSVQLVIYCTQAAAFYYGATRVVAGELVDACATVTCTHVSHDAARHAIASDAALPGVPSDH